MKNCKHCGKPLDEEANFCPYCMKRQSEPVTAPKINVKRRLPKLLLLIPVLLVAALAIWLLPKGKPDVSVRQTQASAYDIHAQFGDLLGMTLSAVQDFFGSELAPTTLDPFTETETHYFDGIELDVLPRNEKIYGYTIDYGLSDPPHRYNYRGIDSSATYQDVVSLLGLPDGDTGYPYEIVYETQKGYLKIFFDEQLKVTKLYALFPLE